MDWHSLVPLSLPGLFLVAFLAATLLPLGSEWLLVALLLAGQDPLACVVVATAGNLCGAVTSWGIGRAGSPWLMRRVLRIDAAAEARADAWFRRYGSWSLLLSWLPVVGDPLCLAAGLLAVPFPRFLLLTGLGKGARYATVAWLTLLAR